MLEMISFSILANTSSENAHNYLYSVLLLIAAIICASIAVVAWKRRNIGPVASTAALFMLATSWWGVTYAVHWSGLLQPGNLFWLDATYPGVVLVPATFLAFSLRFTGRGDWLTRKRIAILAVEPLVTLVLLWTDSFHNLFFAGLRSGNTSCILRGGLWFWVNVIYSYTLILIAFVIILRFAAKTRGVYRKQALFILFGSFLPWISCIAGVMNISPVHDLDLTPFGFTLTGIAFAYALFRLNLLNIVPVARDALVEIMSDGFFVVDLKNHVVDINLAAQEFLGISKSSIGSNAEVLFRNTPELVRLYRNVEEGDFELFTEFYGQRYLNMHIVPLFDKRNRNTGRLFIFRDISARKTGEIKLQKANDLLQKQLSEIRLLQTELKRQAIRDPLTNLYNRRYLEEFLENEISKASREETSLSVLMLDIDFFKAFNDTYGHRAGDAVLKKLGELFLTQTRTGGDIACRYGGEEFVIVLTNTSLKDAVCRAEQFRISFEAMKISVGEDELSATLSIGVAAFPEHGLTGESILYIADNALYKAKETGRNRLVTA